MAPWYELFLACKLKADPPQQVIDVLNYLINNRSIMEEMIALEPIVTPTHLFFQIDGWEWILADDPEYFPGIKFATLTKNTYSEQYHLTARIVARRGYSLIAAFLHWLAPYSDTDGVVGHTRCDESRNIVELISFEDGEVYYNLVDLYQYSPTIKQAKVIDGNPPVYGL